MCAGISFVPAGDERPDPTALITQLDSPIYAQRRAAFRSLLRQGVDEDATISCPTVRAIRTACQHHSLEVRLSAIALLDQINSHQIDTNLTRLRDPRFPVDSIQIDGWDAFAKLAGDDMLARQFYVRVYERKSDASQVARVRDGRQPAKLTRDDRVGWVMALWFDMQEIQGNPTARSKLGVLLSQPTLGPELSKHPHSAILSRMIAVWLKTTPTTAVSVSQKLRIALRYDQRVIANQLIEEILADERAWPESRMTALLAACVLEHRDTKQLAHGWLEDRRTGCVWNLIANEKKRIRTQVCDVAMVVLLQTRGVDPRAAGFDYLEADPILIFRDHSLGFPDEKTRELAHLRATELLGRVSTSE
ncbi:MAG: hypothetical protein AAGI63_13820 [Planctomycetota bacterium]